MCKFINNRWYGIYWSNSEYWTNPTMKFSKYDYILNEPALSPSLQPSEVSEDESEDEDGAMSPQQDSAGANSSSEDNQTREPPPTQENEEPRMITPVTLLQLCRPSGPFLTVFHPFFILCCDLGSLSLASPLCLTSRGCASPF
jgi:hypothetical protein